MEKYFFGIGRRKSAIARVRLFKGSGKVLNADNTVIENKIFTESVSKPLQLVSQDKSFDMSFRLSGGGWNSQMEAGSLAVARALSKVDENFEKTLKKEGFLTRDPREKERKKPGLRGARRAPQWAKR
jgi:small subunit ribosomal protein S9